MGMMQVHLRTSTGRFLCRTSLYRCFVVSLVLCMVPIHVWASSRDNDHHHGDRFASAHSRFYRKGTRPKYARNLPFLIQHLKLTLKVLPKKRFIEGHVLLTLTASARSITRVTLDAAELNIRSVSVGGQKLKWLLEGNKLHITLRTPLLPKTQRNVRIDYSASPRSGLHFILPGKAYPNKPVTVYSQGESIYNRFWVPTFDSTNMRYTSETIITVPKPLMVIANGRLIKKTEKGAFVTYHHTMKYNHVTYLLSLVIGQFAVFKQIWKGIPILSYSPLRLAQHAKRSFENTKDMMEFFSSKIGFAYPYSKYAQVAVHDFISGGMENITATTLNHQTLHSASAHLTRRSDGLVAHELAHQWFGDLLTCKDWGHLWLNESFATYFAQLYTEHKWGKAMFNYTRKSSLGWYYGSHYHRPIRTRMYEHPSDMFDAHSYPKGAAVLHMLRRKLGDRLWWKGIQLYVKRHAHGLVETSDLRRALEKVSGLNLEPFFDQWIHTAGHPVVKFSWSFSPKSKQIRVTLRQTQSNRVYRFATQLRIFADKKQRVVSIDVSKKRQTFVFSAKKRPKLVELDAQGDMLMHLSAKKSRQQWLYQLLHGSSMLTRTRAAKQLYRFPNDPKVFAGLKHVLLERRVHFGLRAAAARSLRKMDSKKACTLLLRDGLRIEEARVRQIVAQQLGYCKRRQDVWNALLAVMRTDVSSGVRTKAVGAVARLRHKDSFKMMVEALRQKQDYGRIQTMAVQAMSALETPKAIPYLYRMMQAGNELRPRLAAMGLYAAAIVRFRKKKKAQHYLSLVGFLKDPHPWVRGTAIRALATLGDWRALPIMRRYAAQAPNWTTTRRTRRAIKRLYKQTKAKKGMKYLAQDLEKLHAMHSKLLKRMKRLEKQRTKRK